MKKRDLKSKLIWLVFLILLSVGNITELVAQTIDLDKTSITVNKGESLEELFSDISEQTGYAFFYNSELKELNSTIDKEIYDKPVSTILEHTAENMSLEYVVEGKDIVVRKKKSNTTTQQEQDDTVVIGVVKDNAGDPLPGASVHKKGTTIGASTNFDGEFQLVVDEGDILIFSYIGFEEQEVTYRGQKEINIVLIEDGEVLNEVVVVGYGTQKVKDITGALSHVDSKAIEERPITQVSDALAGKAAGVQVIVPSGKPQGGASIRIRGTTSITASSDPLYVIDGVPTTSMYDVNPSDIESISILKDASAAAIYGSAGANGVVIIQTKRGKNKKGTLSFNSYYGVSELNKKMGTLSSSQYIDLMDELGLTADWSNYTENTDWQDEVYRRAVRQNYQLSLAGSNESTNYYVSGNFQANEGIIRTSSADRLTGKINIDQKVTKWLKLGTSVMYANWHDVEVSENVGRGNGSPVTGAIITPSLIGIYNEDGTYTGNPLAPDWENPVATTDASERGYSSNRFLGSAFLEATIIEGLTFKTRFSLDDSKGVYKYYLDNYTTDQGRAKNGMATESTNSNSFWLNENLLTYTKAIGKSNFTAMGGVIISEAKTYSMSTSVSNFANNIIKNINAGTLVENASSFETERSNLSYLARVNYSYNNKYLFTGNFRADASSIFGNGNSWGFFPSFSAGWRLTEEEFLKSQNIFDDIKIRAGWGEVGNDRIAPYSYYGKTGTGYDYVFNGTITPGMAAQTLENQDLRWEKTTQTDIGLDLSLLDYKLNFIVDYYQKNTSDLLLDVPIPTSSGFVTSMQNVGEIQNRGIELTMMGDVIQKGDFNWNTNFNISFNRNEVINLKGEEIFSGSISQRGNVVRTIEGEQMGNFWGFVSEGVDPSTGDMIYADLDGDGEITAEGDKQIIGNANPDFIYGFTNTFSYKGFGLSIFLQGSQGNDIFNASRILTEGMNDHKSQSDAVLNRWRQEGDKTDIPRATTAGGPNGEAKYNSMLSSRFVEDGSFLRIKTVTLSYNFSDTLLEKIYMSNAKIYLTGENLFTFTNYSGYDPEVNAFGGSNLVQGVDYGTYPQARSIIMGINLSF